MNILPLTPTNIKLQYPNTIIFFPRRNPGFRRPELPCSKWPIIVSTSPCARSKGWRPTTAPRSSVTKGVSRGASWPPRSRQPFFSRVRWLRLQAELCYQYGFQRCDVIYGCERVSHAHHQGSRGERVSHAPIARALVTPAEQ